MGAKVTVGYYDQTQSGLDLSKTVIDEVWDAYPDMVQTQIRNALAAFLFQGDDVFKRVSLLSGGERARLLLLKLMLARDNLLLLDEPTNHLDIASREALEQALSGYDGTIFIVSHDRYFINRLANKVLRLTENDCQEFIGNYDTYIEKFRESEQHTITEQPQKENTYKLQKEQESNRRRLATRIRRCEDEIAESEQKIAAFHTQLELEEVAADYTRVLEISGELENENKRLEQLMEQWENYQMEAEE
jgi:ATP-binding cassette subfamily F protein 3